MKRLQGKSGIRRLPIILSLLLFVGVLLPVGMLPSYAIGDASANQPTVNLPSELIPGGMPFGVQLQTKGVLIVGMSPVNPQGDGVCPAEEAGIAVRDVILSIGDREVDSVSKVAEILAASGGKELTLTVERAGKRMEKHLKPIRSDKDGIYRAGIWIRDSAAGIGTVTFLCPKSHGFAGLGHGICDPDTGTLMPMSRGSVMNVVIGSVQKGREGSPGELRGYFSGERVGALLGNTECGAYGMLSVLPKNLGDPIPVGNASEVHTGDAYILCTLDDSQSVKKYPIRITKIFDRKRENKNFLVEVTDRDLIAQTGGIVQGMSGSPIIQDGKLIGAITHVMVENPKQGYGIFIENMLERMPELLR
ncbi:MAG: SpoIVB peptidase [Eubacteriales bacterium]